LAVKLEWIDKTPFRNYQLKFQKFERSYLNERELRLIEGTFFKDESLERVKDIFLFSCYTGISYFDLFNLDKAAVIEGSNSRLWVYLNRQKTGQKVKIPLLNKAQIILKKYWNFPSNNPNKALPVPCNQNINKKLKEIVKGAGIGKTVTFHSARHTFATTVTLSNGVPIETVSKLLGHTKLSTTQIYARVLEEKIGQEMEILNEKILSSEKRPGANCRKGKSYRTRI
ncbi:MAG: site-specific integrase, partial [Flavobacteriaceae bacterium]|nr:site-specific integrase [Flavobacteriaceae bacterium]